MIVIADTGPINYLIQIGEIEILPTLYGRIIVPLSVSIELNHPRAPDIVRQWMSQLPTWFDTQSPNRAPDNELMNAHLDAGERDAILYGNRRIACPVSKGLRSGTWKRPRDCFERSYELSVQVREFKRRSMDA
jgi:predicted nucleic acid-binding protein